MADRRRDQNDINCQWLPAILITKAWKKLWCQEKKHGTHTVRLTKCMCMPAYWTTW